MYVYTLEIIPIYILGELMFNQLAPICEPMLPASCMLDHGFIPTPLGMKSVSLG